MPLVVHFINQPSTFSQKDFAYSISTNKLSIAGPEEIIDTMSQIDIRYVDLKTVKPGDIITLNVELSTGLINVENITTVDVTIQTKKIIEKTFNVTNFNVVGLSEDINVNVITKRLNNVRLVGDKDLINNITSNDIVAEINLNNTALSTGTISHPITITVPGKNGVFWAYGEYEAVIRIN